MPTNEPNIQHEPGELDNGPKANYKLQLDQAARDALKSPSEIKKSSSPPANPVLAFPVPCFSVVFILRADASSAPENKKVSQYIPAVGKLLGAERDEVKKPDPTPEQIPGPPERPTHDIQIEEFVRDQHRSRTEDVEDAKVQ
ncbi:hypothetical protein PpBr36_03182 [Pyricularia pennisetigena]|uniref:hypothetical protein n=1 Tax=Pyricularia pennisetigena TaxID=1578925 RepID=UPI0011544402|nr:hypothetical protein PpBr36_03182 [Pyricularia pennisetigena]TLS30871.1 hypothetical protein PpBr36_03182 [Pyricularia pennisetigena]